MRNDPIYLNLNLKNENFQGVFYGHIFGSTIVIAMKVDQNSIVIDNNLLTSFRAEFFSKTMNGYVNFALNNVNGTTKVVIPTASNKAHKLNLSLNGAESHDEPSINPVTVTFNPPLDITKDVLQIVVIEDDVTNKEHFNACPRDVNQDRSCNNNIIYPTE